MPVRHLALACLSLATPHVAMQDGHATPMSAPGRVTLPEGGSVTLLVPDRRLPMVEVYVGEAGPFHFVVEWAGNVFAVSERVREEAQLETIARSPMGTDVVAVPYLGLGDTLFEDLVAEVPPFFTRTNHDGALGLNVFRDLVGTLDFPRGELRLSETALPDPEDDPEVIAYSPGPGGSPRVPIQLAGHSFLAVLDTAAERALILDDSFLETLTMAGELRAGPMIMTPGMGRLQTREGRIAGELAIGSIRSSNPLALIHRMREPEILLGGGFLRDYAITLDQANLRLRLDLGESQKD
jgi:hypothetical protein